MLATAATVTACASPPPATPEGIADRIELHDVPFYPQERYQCGPAALATVIADLGQAIDPTTLVGEVYIPQRQGSLPAEMRAATRNRGLVAYPQADSIDALLRTIDAGYPVLVMQNLGLDWWPQWHYAVVVGYDLEQQTLVLRSATQRRRIDKISTFRNTWSRADHWAQVVIEPDDIPPGAQPLRWLEVIHEIEERNGAHSALTGYRAATERWPAFQAAWMALGNAAWQTQEQEQASQAFRRAAETAPGTWTGWNNLAHSLGHAGCGAQAARAAYCAQRLAPDHEAARETLARFQNAEGHDHCLSLPPCPALH